jgi:hypothetical protein
MTTRKPYPGDVSYSKSREEKSLTNELLDEHSKKDVVRIRVVQALTRCEVRLVPEGDGDQILRVPDLAQIR